MAPRRPAIPPAALVADLFPEARAALAGDVRAWLEASDRFRVFAETYRDKIRKKARGVRDDDGARDLAFELRVAARLLEDPRVALEYEPHGIGRRAPDLVLTFRANVRCGVEVRRLRGGDDPSRLARIVSEKLGQLLPGMPNVLVLGPARVEALGAALRTLGSRPGHERLSAVVCLREDGAGALWRNARARHPLHDGLARALGTP